MTNSETMICPNRECPKRPTCGDARAHEESLGCGHITYYGLGKLELCPRCVRIEDYMQDGVARNLYEVLKNKGINQVYPVKKEGCVMNEIAKLEIGGYHERATMCGILLANGYPVVQITSDDCTSLTGSRSWVSVFEKMGSDKNQ